MGLMLIFISGFLILIVAILSMFGIVSGRSSKSTDELKTEISNLENRIDELENDKKNKT